MAVKILSVDDELDLEMLLSQYFRRKIRKGEYEFTFAHNGLEALKLMLTQQDFDIILSDINMPEMDGLTLLAKINEMRNPALKCIIVSAYGDMENIRSAMNQGAFDFATKPIDLEDLERTIEKAVEQINFIKQAQAEHSQLTSLQNDLSIAREIQQSILPKNYPPLAKPKSFDIHAFMKAAKYVGGDFYDFFRINDNQLGFVIADVADKGIPAAIFMAISRTVIRAIALEERDVAQCIKKSNTILCQESVNSMFVSVFYGILNINTGVITYCNAGHNAPVLIKRGSEVSFIPLTHDVVLGVVEEADFHEKELTLAPGDSLLLYTDGVTEAMNPQFEQYSDGRLLETCQTLAGKSAEVIVTTVTQSVTDFVEGALPSDDITLLSIVYKG